VSRWVAGALAVALVAGTGSWSPVAASPTPSPTAAEATDADGAEVPTSSPEAVAELDRAVEAARTLRYRGRLTVASFGRGGPQVTTVDVARSADGRLRAEQQGAWELGRDETGSYLRTERTGSLLRLGGVEVRAFDRERFLGNYRVDDGGTSQLDTGPARVLLVRRLGVDERAETLHVDAETGLIVRRETRDADGAPVRVVAFTELEVDPATGLLTPPDESGDVERVSLAPVERSALEAAGLPARDRLPGGFELLDATEVEGAETPTAHLVYGDGLYTLSLYVQRGRLAQHATAGATALPLEEGGSVWRWPGSEPRRVVWSGDGVTFTAMTDAPTGVLLAAVAGLPNEPAPSTLQRLARGLARVGERLLPPWG
jgi:hypothetical protein